MKLKVEDFEIDVMKQSRPSKWFPRRGWYWQEIHLPPNGPFGSVGDALRNLTDKVESDELAADIKEAMRRRRERRGSARIRE
jgi:hypothetical protein